MTTAKDRSEPVFLQTEWQKEKLYSALPERTSPIDIL